MVSAKSAWGLGEIFSTRVAYSYTYSGLRVSFSCLISLISLFGLCAFREKLFSESRLGKSAESVNKARKGISQIPDANGEHPTKRSKHERTLSDVEATAVVGAVVSGNSSLAYLDNLYEVASPLDPDSNAFRSTNPDRSTTLPDSEAPAASLLPSIDSDPSDAEFSSPLLSLTTAATMATHPITPGRTNLTRPTAVVKNPL